MTDTERHVKRFVFGRLLPVRGVDHVWERRYGWHWVVQREFKYFEIGQGWLIDWFSVEWLHEVKPKQRANLSCPPPP